MIPALGVRPKWGQRGSEGRRQPGCVLDLVLLCKMIHKALQALWTLFRDAHMSGLSRQGKRVLWPGPRRTGRAVTEEGSGTDGSRPGLSRKYQMSGNQIQQDMSRNTQSRVGLRAVSGQSVTWGKVSPFALQTQGSGVRP